MQERIAHILGGDVHMLHAEQSRSAGQGLTTARQSTVTALLHSFGATSSSAMHLQHMTDVKTACFP